MKDFAGKFHNRPRLIRRKASFFEKQFSQGKLFAIIAVFFIVAMFFVLQRTEYIRTEKRVRKLILEKQKIAAEILTLKLEERYRTRLNLVEKKAREKLQLDNPQSNQIITIPVSTSQ